MAAGAKSNQIEIVIRTLLATQLFVMNLQVLPGTTDLASPAIAAENLLSVDRTVRDLAASAVL